MKRTHEGAVLTLAEGDRSILDALYGVDTEAASPEDLLVTYEPTLSDPAGQIREVLSSANRGGGTLALVAADGDRFVIEGEFPMPPVQPEVVGIDLKWSLWCRHEDDIEERAPGLVVRMRAAFSGDAPPLLIHTAPRKEIRFGSVHVSKGGAEVEFSFEWDEPHELAASVDDHLAEEMSDEEHDWVSGIVADHLAENYCEFRRHRLISEEDFGQLMEAIDAVEDELLEGERSLSAAFDEFVRGLAETVKERRQEGAEP